MFWAKIVHSTLFLNFIIKSRKWLNFFAKNQDFDNVYTKLNLKITKKNYFFWQNGLKQHDFTIVEVDFLTKNRGLEQCVLCSLYSITPPQLSMVWWVCQPRLWEMNVSQHHLCSTVEQMSKWSENGFFCSFQREA